jgi:hypothetical protein
MVMVAVMPSATPVFAQEVLPGIEIQSSGPIHEAFARPVVLVPPRPAAVTTQPPAPPAEEPPDLRPPGDDIQWISGYWAWDHQRRDFVWVSGVWRKPPPGQTYIAGYWARMGDKWRRVRGFWTDPRRPDLAYLPKPPAPEETDIKRVAPDEDTVFVPGHWAYQKNRYVWRPGTWIVLQPGLVWVPTHYVWTPAGYFFVPGYWDYPLERRGLMFAPVVFQQPVWRKAGWVYRPASVINPILLLQALFIGPGHGSYYFGNYYRPIGGVTYFAWYQYGPSRFDPLYTYYRFQNRNNASWATNLSQVYINKAAGKASGASVALVGPLAKATWAGGRLTTVNAAQRKTYQATARRFNEAASVRVKAEAKGVFPVAGKTGPTLKLASVAHTSLKTAPRPQPPEVRHTESKRTETTKSKGGSTETKTKTVTDTKTKGGTTETKKTTVTDTKSKGGSTQTKSKTVTETKSKGGATETKSKTTETKSKSPPKDDKKDTKKSKACLEPDHGYPFTPAPAGARVAKCCMDNATGEIPPLPRLQPAGCLTGSGVPRLPDLCARYGPDPAGGRVHGGEDRLQPLRCLAAVA